jgi:hypothetical protein
MKTRETREAWRPDLLSDVPSSWMMVEHHLRMFGGWSKMFGRSSQTYDEEVIHKRENEPGFWMECEMALMEKQFADAVLQMALEFRETYPGKKIKRKELIMKLSLALLQSGWKPVKSRIMKEIRDIKRQKRDEILALRGGLTKTQWNKKRKGDLK